MSSPRKSVRLDKQFEIKLAAFQGQLKKYIKDPTPEVIHDIRTMYRRLEACYSLFPRSRRNAKSEKYLRLGKKFFSANSQIRDTDIIADKLERLITEQATHQDDARRLLQDLELQRTARLAPAMRLARHLDRLPQPHLEATHRLILQRLRKLVQKRSNAASRIMPRILAAECEGDDIHSMRKQVKKLCYLLELITPSNKRQKLSELKYIQHLAGVIHDCDVTIEYLNDCSSRAPGSAKLVKMERTQRHKQYVKLVKELEETTWTMVTKDT